MPSHGRLYGYGLTYANNSITDHMEQVYKEFAVAVLVRAINKEGMKYLGTPGSDFWCRIGDIDPETIHHALTATGGKVLAYQHIGG